VCSAALKEVKRREDMSSKILVIVVNIGKNARLATELFHCGRASEGIDLLIRRDLGVCNFHVISHHLSRNVKVIVVIDH